MKEVTQLETEVQDYYGKELKGSDDLKTNACCTATPPPTRIKDALKNIHDEVITRYYGCGLTIPTKVQGLRVLDLGSGAGRDCYLLSQLVGAEGSVVGIDMTDEQLAVANAHIDWHRERFSYAESNVGFVKGNIQDLAAAGLASDDFDLIISNCVVNLAANKKAVLSEAYRVLREGGEFYFSDVYCDRRIPAHLVNDKELYGECLSGALYWNDFANLAKEVGFADPRIVESRRLTIENESVQEKTEGFRFYSVTYRLFKLPELEAACEDYGQAIKYVGGLDEEPLHFRLDDHHVFEAGKIVPVCGNTWFMLANTRYRSFFEFYGNFENHYGIFEGCGTVMPYAEDSESSDEQACC
ncbi:MAG: methyltransferase [Pseudohongiella sp.]|nr:MAG: methyltransferase [Pseudohongiella sp.]